MPGLTNYPSGFSGGVNIRGLPILNTYAGKVFWVDSATGSNQNRGTFDRPWKTLDSAFDARPATQGVKANRGDVVMVKAGHVETVSAAGGLDLDVAGVHVIGIGNGPDTPIIALDTATTADVDVDAAGITIENLHFTSGFADIAVCLDVNSTDFTARDCRFTEAANNQNFLVCIQDASGATSDRLIIEGCYALQDDAANTHFVNFAGTGKGCIVRNNVLMGDWGTMAVGGAGVVTFCTVMDNVIYNAATTVDGCINFAATATGICMRNLCGGAAAQANGVTATAFAIAENYYGVLSEDLSAILDPIAT